MASSTMWASPVTYTMWHPTVKAIGKVTCKCLVSLQACSRHHNGVRPGVPEPERCAAECDSGGHGAGLHVCCLLAPHCGHLHHHPHHSCYLQAVRPILQVQACQSGCSCFCLVAVVLPIVCCLMTCMQSGFQTSMKKGHSGLHVACKCVLNHSVSFHGCEQFVVRMVNI